jgi:hypothetical protein
MGWGSIYPITRKYQLCQTPEFSPKGVSSKPLYRLDNVHRTLLDFFVDIGKVNGHNI